MKRTRQELERAIDRLTAEIDEVISDLSSLEIERLELEEELSDVIDAEEEEKAARNSDAD